ncbi:hypothetical protein [Chroococcidiopsis sp. SAG 2025]|uniref:hypothetical protein n=1 Tax=Chroococcidiopsis sp. SAG 2025 TaxID=171389 RepID=UPI002936DB2D|nr:hypothetical protein [Chroococcidiopsis sp. SAG 2025]
MTKYEYQLSVTSYQLLHTTQLPTTNYHSPMNFRAIIFSGVVTAAIGAVVGLAATRIGQRDFNQLRFEGKHYEGMQNRYVLIGASVGLAVGLGQECVRQLKAERDRETE